MQGEQRLADNYAAALLQLADSEKKSEAYYNELKSVGELFKQSSELRQVLTTPTLGSVSRSALFEKLLGEINACKEVSNLLRILLKNRRIELLPLVVSRAAMRLDRVLKRRSATVTSAKELSGEEKDKLKKKLKSMTGDQVEVAFDLQEGLVGGFVVQLGYDIYDCSIHAQLELLRDRVFAARI